MLAASEALSSQFENYDFPNGTDPLPDRSAAGSNLHRIAFLRGSSDEMTSVAALEGILILTEKKD